MKKAIGIILQGEQPTADEKLQLETRAKAEIPGSFEVKRIVAWDVVEQKRIVRLDAYEQ